MGVDPGRGLAPGPVTAPGPGIALGLVTAGPGLPRRRGPALERGPVPRIDPGHDPGPQKRPARRKSLGLCLGPDLDPGPYNSSAEKNELCEENCPIARQLSTISGGGTLRSNGKCSNENAVMDNDQME